MGMYGSALEDMERRSFLQKARDALLDKIGQRPGGYMGGPTAGQFGTITGGQPTAGESQAFNQRNLQRAQYGDRWNTKGGIGRPGLEREKISSAERIRTMMEAGESARRGVMETGATGRQKMVEGTRQREQDLRYGRGDAFSPIGVDRSIAETGRYRAETERMFPKGQIEKPPQVYSPTGGQMGEKAPYTIRQDPSTGEYYEVPIKQKPLTVEEQKQWDELRRRQGLK